MEVKIVGTFPMPCKTGALLPPTPNNLEFWGKNGMGEGDLRDWLKAN